MLRPHTPAATCRHAGALPVLALLALLALAPAQAQTCTFEGVASLVLASGPPQDAYTVCLPALTLSVGPNENGECAVTLTPHPMVDRLKFALEPCPTEPLTALVGPDGSPLDALNSALSNALQQVAVPAAAIDSATFEKSLKRLAVSNPGGDLSYYVSDGKGAWEAARSAEEACAPKDEACLAPKECKEGWYRTTDAAALCALCMAGHTCEGGQPSPCPPGSAAEWAGSTSCAPCEVNTYADTKGNSHCDSCPEGSGAHFTGSQGCLSCYFGEPKVAAGTVDGVPGFASMPSEQPRPGFRIFTFVGGNLQKCEAQHPFMRCKSVEKRVMALETDETCLVRAYVLGDPGCSVAVSAVEMFGAYKTLNVVESRNEPGDKERDDVARQGGAVLRLDLADPKAPSLTITNAAFGDACVTWVELAKPGLRSCPLGTVRDANPLGGAAFAPEQCAPCEPGTACADNPDGAPEAQSPLALPCAPGQYNELWGATECAACTGLKMSAFPGATLCQECGPGLTPNEKHDLCIPCPGGYYNTAPGQECMKCAPGTYRSAEGGDPTECSKCWPGSWSGEGADDCNPCDVGFYQEQEGQAQCLACPAGSIAAVKGSLGCDNCEPGTIQPKEGQGFCIDCGAGKYTIAKKDGSGPTQCNECPRGTYKEEGAKDNKCNSCPAGLHTVVPSGAPTCIQCPAGTYASAPNTVTCTQAPPGSFQDTAGQKTFKMCPAGHVSVTDKGLAGTPDGVGDAALKGATACAPCPYRTFRPSIYAPNTCTLCPIGRETKLEVGASTCNACIPGMSLLNDTALALDGSVRLSINCTLCEPGSAVEDPGSSGACPLCPAGSYSGEVGSQLCDICAPGTYQDTPGSQACIECPVGTYTEMTGATSPTDCQPAPAGNYAEGSGNDGFVPCPAGTYQDQQGQGACKPCPPGHGCPVGSVSPRPCAAGFAADSKQPFCRECAKGSFQNLAKQRSCKPCPAGSYCPGTKTVNPVPCPAGTINGRLSAATASSCARCPINTFSAEPGKTACSKCSALGSNLWTGRMTGQKTCWSKTLLRPPTETGA